MKFTLTCTTRSRRRRCFPVLVDVELGVAKWQVYQVLLVRLGITYLFHEYSTLAYTSKTEDGTVKSRTNWYQLTVNWIKYIIPSHTS